MWWSSSVLVVGPTDRRTSLLRLEKAQDVLHEHLLEPPEAAAERRRVSRDVGTDAALIRPEAENDRRAERPLLVALELRRSDEGEPRPLSEDGGGRELLLGAEGADGAESARKLDRAGSAAPVLVVEAAPEVSSAVKRAALPDLLGGRGLGVGRHVLKDSGELEQQGEGEGRRRLSGKWDSRRVSEFRSEKKTRIRKKAGKNRADSANGFARYSRKGILRNKTNGQSSTSILRKSTVSTAPAPFSVSVTNLGVRALENRTGSMVPRLYTSCLFHFFLPPALSP